MNDNNQFSNYNTNDLAMTLLNNYYFVHAFIETRHQLTLQYFLETELHIRGLKDYMAKELEEILIEWNYKKLKTEDVNWKELEEFFRFEIASYAIERFCEIDLSQKDKEDILKFYKIKGGDK
jgi:hypothetical protein